MNPTYLNRSLTLAHQSVQNGNHPFGALLVLDGLIVAEAENTVITQEDVTKHAELNLISKCAHLFSEEEKKRMVLYSSTEPCAMCTGAIVWSGVRSIVYGCSSKQLNLIARGSFTIECRKILSHSLMNFEVSGPYLDEGFTSIHQEFWK